MTVLSTSWYSLKNSFLWHVTWKVIFNIRKSICILSTNILPFQENKFLHKFKIYRAVKLELAVMWVEWKLSASDPVITVSCPAKEDTIILFCKRGKINFVVIWYVGVSGCDSFRWQVTWNRFMCYFLCFTEMFGEGPTYAAVKDILHHASKFHHLMDSEHCSICDQNILSYILRSCSW
jgi:hypothetical protein